MYFVGGVRIPDDELPVLRGGHEMATVGSPMHRVDLSQMTLQCATGSHNDTGQGFDFGSHRTHWIQRQCGADNMLVCDMRRNSFEYVRLVSADDSFFALIFSFRLSASRRAAAILS